MNNSCLNSFNISSVFSVWLIISSTVSCFSILLLFDLVTASMILFSKNSPALWTLSLEAVFRTSSLVFNNYFFILSCRWWKSKSFNIFSCSWFYRILPHCQTRRMCHFYLLVSNVKLNLSSISNSLPFWSVNIMMISSSHALYVFKNPKFTWLNI